jgi:integrase
VHVKLHIALFGTGERFPVLLDKESGQPARLATRYVVRIRRARQQVGTISNDLRSIGALYNWFADQGIDLEDRLGRRELLTASEIGGFATFLRSGRQEKVIGRIGKVNGVLSANVLNTNLASVRRFLEWVYDAKLGTSLSGGDLEKAKQKLEYAFRAQALNTAPTPRKYALTKTEDEELLRLIDPQASDNPFHKPGRERNYLMIRLFLETGMRRGELSKLKVGDVVTHGPEPHVNVKRRPGDPQDPRRIEPAVKTLERRIVISRPLARLVIDYLRYHRGRQRHPYLFCSTRGQVPLTLSGVDGIFMEIRRYFKPEQGKFSPHILRHTFFTRIAEIINRSGAEPGYAQGVKNYVAGWADGSKQHVVYERQLAEADAAEFTKLLHGELYKEEVR